MIYESIEDIVKRELNISSQYLQEKVEDVLKQIKQDDAHKMSKNETNENNDLHNHRS